MSYVLIMRGLVTQELAEAIRDHLRKNGLPPEITFEIIDEEEGPWLSTPSC